MKGSISKIGFGGGCHWCTEAFFQVLKGVKKVEQGWIASFDKQSSFSEAVIVSFDPLEISLDILVKVHLETHQSSSNHSMRKKYRSAVYTFTASQKGEAKTIIKSLQHEFDHKLITQVYSFKSFKPSPVEIQNYYRKNPSKPFCQKYIEPKLQFITDHFETQLNIER